MAAANDTDPVAWIVGASAGIGRALALELLHRGWRVAASARSPAGLAELTRSAGPGLVTYAADVTDPEGLAATARAVEQDLGPITHCFLNAGTYEPMPLQAFDPVLFRQAMEVNTLGVVHGIAAVLPLMQARGRGQILATASVAGYVGLPGGAPYGASKAAILNLAEALAPELAEQGIRLRVISPGFVKSRLTDKNRFPMPFLMGPEDAARRIVRGLDSHRFEIHFPWQMSLGLKLLRCLPRPLQQALTRRMIPR